MLALGSHLLLFSWICLSVMETVQGVINMKVSTRCTDNVTSSWTLTCTATGINLSQQSSVSWRKIQDDENTDFSNTFEWQPQRNITKPSNYKDAFNGRLQKVLYDQNSLILQFSRLEHEDMGEWTCKIRERNWGSEHSESTTAPHKCPDSFASSTQSEGAGDWKPTATHLMIIIAVAILAMLITLAVLAALAFAWCKKKLTRGPLQSHGPACHYHEDLCSCPGGEQDLYDIESIRPAPSVHSYNSRGQYSQHKRSCSPECCQQSMMPDLVAGEPHQPAPSQVSNSSLLNRSNCCFELDNNRRRPAVSKGSSCISRQIEKGVLPVFPTYQSEDVSPVYRLDPELLMPLLAHNAKMACRSQEEIEKRRRRSSF